MLPLPRGAVWQIFFLLCAVLLANEVRSEGRVVCYYTNWSVYRPGTAKFNPQNINPYLCTHLVYAFGGFTKDNTMKPFDKYQDIEQGGYAKFTGLKTYNKQLKTMIAIGGWNEASSRFSPLVASSERRQKFIKNILKFLRQNHFDGIDLDWEYPAHRDGGKDRDKDNYAQFVQELRMEFDRESAKTGRPRLLLTMAVPAGIQYIEKGYDIPKLNKYLDWFNMLTYDFHSSHEPSANHHAPLYSMEEDDEYNFDSDLNIDYSVKYYLDAGADRDKLVLGIPTYGRSYTLFNEESTDLGAPADGPGEQGDATREKGYLAYYEICQNIKEDPDWKVVQPNPKAMGPYAFKGNQWVGYDDEAIVRKKAEYVVDHGLGGIMFWAIDNDDFRGTCTGKPYPLIEAAKETYLDRLGVGGNEISKPTSQKKPSRNRNRVASANRNKVEDVPEKAVSVSRKRPATRKRPQNERSTTTTTTTGSSLYVGGRTTTPEPPTTPDPGSDFKCEDEGFFQHPRDCKKYFWCLDSGPSNLGIVAHQFTCPSGLYFNPAADSCDFARNVPCKKNPKEPASTTTSKPKTTSTTTTARTTTSSYRVTAATSRNSFARFTSTTTQAPEEDEEEYEDEVEDAAVDAEEDPRVIKELIDLIKKVGGIEELEKHLLRQEDGSVMLKKDEIVPSGATTTPASISKSLFEKVLNRPNNLNAFRNKFTSSSLFSTNSRTTTTATKEDEGSVKEDSSAGSRYSSVVRNSRPGPQNAGIEKLPEFDGFLKEKKQYVTIQRTRPLLVASAEQSDDDDDTKDVQKDAEDEDDEDEVVVTSSSRRPTTSTPAYTSIRRTRPSTVRPEEEEEDDEDVIPEKKTYSPLNRNRVRSTTDVTPADIETTTVGGTRYKFLERTRPTRRPTVAVTQQSDVDEEADGSEGTLSITVQYSEPNEISTQSPTQQQPQTTTRAYASIGRRTTTTSTTDQDPITATPESFVIDTTTPEPIVITTTTTTTSTNPISIETSTQSSTTTTPILALSSSSTLDPLTSQDVEISSTDLPQLPNSLVTESGLDTQELDSTQNQILTETTTPDDIDRNEVTNPSTTTSSPRNKSQSSLSSSSSNSIRGNSYNKLSGGGRRQKTTKIPNTLDTNQQQQPETSTTTNDFLGTVSSPRPFGFPRRRTRPSTTTTSSDNAAGDDLSSSSTANPSESATPLVKKVSSSQESFLRSRSRLALDRAQNVNADTSVVVDHVAKVVDSLVEGNRVGQASDEGFVKKRTYSWKDARNTSYRPRKISAKEEQSISQYYDWQIGQGARRDDDSLTQAKSWQTIWGQTYNPDLSYRDGSRYGGDGNGFGLNGFDRFAGQWESGSYKADESGSYRADGRGKWRAKSLGQNEDNQAVFRRGYGMQGQDVLSAFEVDDSLTGEQYANRGSRVHGDRQTEESSVGGSDSNVERGDGRYTVRVQQTEDEQTNSGRGNQVRSYTSGQTVGDTVESIRTRNLRRFGGISETALNSGANEDSAKFNLQNTVSTNEDNTQQVIREEEETLKVQTEEEQQSSLVKSQKESEEKQLLDQGAVKALPENEDNKKDSQGTSLKSNLEVSTGATLLTSENAVLNAEEQLSSTHSKEERTGSQENSSGLALQTTELEKGSSQVTDTKTEAIDLEENHTQQSVNSRESLRTRNQNRLRLLAQEEKESSSNRGSTRHRISIQKESAGEAKSIENSTKYFVRSRNQNRLEETAEEKATKEEENAKNRIRVEGEISRAQEEKLNEAKRLLQLSTEDRSQEQIRLENEAKIQEINTQLYKTIDQGSRQSIRRRNQNALKRTIDEDLLRTEGEAQVEAETVYRNKNLSIPRGFSKYESTGEISSESQLGGATATADRGDSVYKTIQIENISSAPVVTFDSITLDRGSGFYKQNVEESGFIVKNTATSDRGDSLYKAVQAVIAEDQINGAISSDRGDLQYNLTSNGGFNSSLNGSVGSLIDGTGEKQGTEKALNSSSTSSEINEGIKAGSSVGLQFNKVKEQVYKPRSSYRGFNEATASKDTDSVHRQSSSALNKAVSGGQSRNQVRSNNDATVDETGDAEDKASARTIRFGSEINRSASGSYKFGIGTDAVVSKSEESTTETVQIADSELEAVIDEDEEESLGSSTATSGGEYTQTFSGGRTATRFGSASGGTIDEIKVGISQNVDQAESVTSSGLSLKTESNQASSDESHIESINDSRTNSSQIVIGSPEYVRGTRYQIGTQLLNETSGTEKIAGLYEIAKGTQKQIVTGTNEITSNKTQIASDPSREVLSSSRRTRIRFGSAYDETHGKTVTSANRKLVGSSELETATESADRSEDQPTQQRTGGRIETGSKVEIDDSHNATGSQEYATGTRSQVRSRTRTSSTNVSDKNLNSGSSVKVATGSRGQVKARTDENEQVHQEAGASGTQAITNSRSRIRFGTESGRAIGNTEINRSASGSYKFGIGSDAIASKPEESTTETVLIADSQLEAVIDEDEEESVGSSTDTTGGEHTQTVSGGRTATKFGSASGGTIDEIKIGISQNVDQAESVTSSGLSLETETKQANSNESHIESLNDSRINSSHIVIGSPENVRGTRYQIGTQLLNETSGIEKIAGIYEIAKGTQKQVATRTNETTSNESQIASDPSREILSSSGRTRVRFGSAYGGTLGKTGFSELGTATESATEAVIITDSDLEAVIDDQSEDQLTQQRTGGRIEAGSEVETDDSHKVTGSPEYVTGSRSEVKSRTRTSSTNKNRNSASSFEIATGTRGQVIARTEESKEQGRKEAGTSGTQAVTNSRTRTRFGTASGRAIGNTYTTANRNLVGTYKFGSGTGKLSKVADSNTENTEITDSSLEANIEDELEPITTTTTSRAPSAFTSRTRVSGSARRTYTRPVTPATTKPRQRVFTLHTTEGTTHVDNSDSKKTQTSTQGVEENESYEEVYYEQPSTTTRPRGPVYRGSFRPKFNDLSSLLAIDFHRKQKQPAATTEGNRVAVRRRRPVQRLTTEAPIEEEEIERSTRPTRPPKPTTTTEVPRSTTRPTSSSNRVASGFTRRPLRNNTAESATQQGSYAVRRKVIRKRIQGGNSTSLGAATTLNRNENVAEGQSLGTEQLAVKDAILNLLDEKSAANATDGAMLSESEVKVDFGESSGKQDNADVKSKLSIGESEGSTTESSDSKRKQIFRNRFTSNSFQASNQGIQSGGSTTSVKVTEGSTVTSNNLAGSRNQIYRNRFTSTSIRNQNKETEAQDEDTTELPEAETTLVPRGNSRLNHGDLSSLLSHDTDSKRRANATLLLKKQSQVRPSIQKITKESVTQGDTITTTTITETTNQLTSSSSKFGSGRSFSQSKTESSIDASTDISTANEDAAVTEATLSQLGTGRVISSQGSSYFRTSLEDSAGVTEEIPKITEEIIVTMESGLPLPSRGQSKTTYQSSYKEATNLVDGRTRTQGLETDENPTVPIYTRRKYYKYLTDSPIIYIGKIGAADQATSSAEKEDINKTILEVFDVFNHSRAAAKNQENAVADGEASVNPQDTPPKSNEDATAIAHEINRQLDNFLVSAPRTSKNLGATESSSFEGISQTTEVEMKDEASKLAIAVNSMGVGGIEIPLEGSGELSSEDAYLEGRLNKESISQRSSGKVNAIEINAIAFGSEDLTTPATEKRTLVREKLEYDAITRRAFSSRPSRIRTTTEQAEDDSSTTERPLRGNYKGRIYSTRERTEISGSSTTANTISETSTFAVASEESLRTQKTEESSRNLVTVKSIEEEATVVPSLDDFESLTTISPTLEHENDIEALTIVPIEVELEAELDSSINEEPVVQLSETTTESHRSAKTFREYPIDEQTEHYAANSVTVQKDDEINNQSVNAAISTESSIKVASRDFNRRRTTSEAPEVTTEDLEQSTADPASTRRTFNIQSRRRPISTPKAVEEEDSNSSSTDSSLLKASQTRGSNQFRTTTVTALDEDDELTADIDEDNEVIEEVPIRPGTTTEQSLSSTRRSFSGLNRVRTTETPAEEVATEIDESSTEKSAAVTRRTFASRTRSRTSSTDLSESDATTEETVPSTIRRTFNRLRTSSARKSTTENETISEEKNEADRLITEKGRPFGSRNRVKAVVSKNSELLEGADSKTDIETEKETDSLNEIVSTVRSSSIASNRLRTSSRFNPFSTTTRQTTETTDESEDESTSSSTDATTRRSFNALNRLRARTTVAPKTSEANEEIDTLQTIETTDESEDESSSSSTEATTRRSFNGLNRLRIRTTTVPTTSEADEETDIDVTEESEPSTTRRTLNGFNRQRFTTTGKTPTTDDSEDQDLQSSTEEIVTRRTFNGFNRLKTTTQGTTESSEVPEKESVTELQDSDASTTRRSLVILSRQRFTTTSPSPATEASEIPEEESATNLENLDLNSSTRSTFAGLNRLRTTTTDAPVDESSTVLEDVESSTISSTSSTRRTFAGLNQVRTSTSTESSEASEAAEEESTTDLENLDGSVIDSATRRTIAGLNRLRATTTDASVDESSTDLENIESSTISSTSSTRRTFAGLNRSRITTSTESAETSEAPEEESATDTENLVLSTVDAVVPTRRTFTSFNRLRTTTIATTAASEDSESPEEESTTDLENVNAKSSDISEPTRRTFTGFNRLRTTTTVSVKIPENGTATELEDSETPTATTRRTFAGINRLRTTTVASGVTSETEEEDTDSTSSTRRTFAGRNRLRITTTSQSDKSEGLDNAEKESSTALDSEDSSTTDGLATSRRTFTGLNRLRTTTTRPNLTKEVTEAEQEVDATPLSENLSTTRRTFGGFNRSRTTKPPAAEASDVQETDTEVELLDSGNTDSSVTTRRTLIGINRLRIKTSSSKVDSEVTDEETSTDLDEKDSKTETSSTTRRTFGGLNRQRISTTAPTKTSATPIEEEENAENLVSSTTRRTLVGFNRFRTSTTVAPQNEEEEDDQTAEIDDEENEEKLPSSTTRRTLIGFNRLRTSTTAAHKAENEEDDQTAEIDDEENEENLVSSTTRRSLVGFNRLRTRTTAAPQEEEEEESDQTAEVDDKENEAISVTGVSSRRPPVGINVVRTTTVATTRKPFVPINRLRTTTKSSPDENVEEDEEEDEEEEEVTPRSVVVINRFTNAQQQRESGRTITQNRFQFASRQRNQDVGSKPEQEEDTEADEEEDSDNDQFSSTTRRSFPSLLNRNQLKIQQSASSSDQTEASEEINEDNDDEQTPRNVVALLNRNRFRPSQAPKVNELETEDDNEEKIKLSVTQSESGTISTRLQQLLANRRTSNPSLVLTNPSNEITNNSTVDSIVESTFTNNNLSLTEANLNNDERTDLGEDQDSDTEDSIVETNSNLSTNTPNLNRRFQFNRTAGRRRPTITRTRTTTTATTTLSQVNATTGEDVVDLTSTSSLGLTSGEAGTSENAELTGAVVTSTETAQKERRRFRVLKFRRPLIVNNSLSVEVNNSTNTTTSSTDSVDNLGVELDTTINTSTTGGPTTPTRRFRKVIKRLRPVANRTVTVNETTTVLNSTERPLNVAELLSTLAPESSVPTVTASVTDDDEKVTVTEDLDLIVTTFESATNETDTSEKSESESSTLGTPSTPNPRRLLVSRRPYRPTKPSINAITSTESGISSTAKTYVRKFNRNFKAIRPPGEAANGIGFIEQTSTRTQNLFQGRNRFNFATRTTPRPREENEEDVEDEEDEDYDEEKEDIKEDQRPIIRPNPLFNRNQAAQNQGNTAGENEQEHDEEEDSEEVDEDQEDEEEEEEEEEVKLSPLPQNAYRPSNRPSFNRPANTPFGARRPAAPSPGNRYAAARRTTAKPRVINRPALITLPPSLLGSDVPSIPNSITPPSVFISNNTRSYERKYSASSTEGTPVDQSNPLLEDLNIDALNARNKKIFEVNSKKHTTTIKPKTLPNQAQQSSETTDTPTNSLDTSTVFDDEDNNLINSQDDSQSTTTEGVTEQPAIEGQLISYSPKQKVVTINRVVEINSKEDKLRRKSKDEELKSVSTTELRAEGSPKLEPLGEISRVKYVHLVDRSGILVDGHSSVTDYTATEGSVFVRNTIPEVEPDSLENTRIDYQPGSTSAPIRNTIPGTDYSVLAERKSKAITVPEVINDVVEASTISLQGLFDSGRQAKKISESANEVNGIFYAYSLGEVPTTPRNEKPIIESTTASTTPLTTTPATTTTTTTTPIPSTTTTTTTTTTPIPTTIETAAETTIETKTVSAPLVSTVNRTYTRPIVPLLRPESNESPLVISIANLDKVRTATVPVRRPVVRRRPITTRQPAAKTSYDELNAPSTISSINADDDVAAGSPTSSTTSLFKYNRRTRPNYLTTIAAKLKPTPKSVSSSVAPSNPGEITSNTGSAASTSSNDITFVTVNKLSNQKFASGAVRRKFIRPLSSNGNRSTTTEANSGSAVPPDGADPPRTQNPLFKRRFSFQTTSAPLTTISAAPIEFNTTPLDLETVIPEDLDQIAKSSIQETKFLHNRLNENLNDRDQSPVISVSSNIPNTTPLYHPSTYEEPITRRLGYAATTRRPSLRRPQKTTPIPEKAPIFISRRRPHKTPAPFNKIIETPTPERTYKPVIDYDYYDDGDERVVDKPTASQVKVVLHGKGIIECLDQGNFPHPLSCRKFISCAKFETGGVVGWEYTCPKGLSYDPVGGMCNWSAGLGCKE